MYLTHLDSPDAHQCRRPCCRNANISGVEITRNNRASADTTSPGYLFTNGLVVASAHAAQTRCGNGNGQLNDASSAITRRLAICSRFHDCCQNPRQNYLLWRALNRRFGLVTSYSYLSLAIYFGSWFLHPLSPTPNGLPERSRGWWSYMGMLKGLPLLRHFGALRIPQEFGSRLEARRIFLNHNS